LVGAVSGIDRDSTGVDIKTLLIDLGVLEQSPFKILPEEAIMRLNIYVHHPSVRGSLVMLQNEACIVETISRFGANDCGTVDTVFVEFVRDSTQTSPDESNEKKRKRPVADDRDAGMQGSILRVN
jgi:hypothetical protein